MYVHVSYYVQVNYLEHVQAVITLNSTRRGSVQLFLRSPMGTRYTKYGAKRIFLGTFLLRCHILDQWFYLNGLMTTTAKMDLQNGRSWQHTHGQKIQGKLKLMAFLNNYINTILFLEENGLLRSSSLKERSKMDL